MLYFAPFCYRTFGPYDFPSEVIDLVKNFFAPFGAVKFRGVRRNGFSSKAKVICRRKKILWPVSLARSRGRITYCESDQPPLFGLLCSIGKVQTGIGKFGPTEGFKSDWSASRFYNFRGRSASREFETATSTCAMSGV